MVETGSAQVGIFAENQPATPATEEKEIPPTPLEGERWVDLSNRDEFIYNGHGYFESVTCERLVKLMPNGTHFCQVLKKETPLVRIEISPADKWDDVLSVAEDLGPEYVEFAMEKKDSILFDFSPEGNLTWLAVRHVEEELQSYQRKKQKPKKAKTQKQKDQEFRERTEKERLAVTVSPDEQVDDFIQELAQRANRFIKQSGKLSPLSPIEADALFKKRLIEEKLNEILSLAGELGFTDEDGQGEEQKLFPEATKTADGAIEAEPLSEEEEAPVEFEVDAATDGVESEGVATLEIPMLLDGSESMEVKEASCDKELGLAATESIEDSQNIVSSEPEVSEAATKETPAKTEEFTPVFVQTESGEWVNTETGEVLELDQGLLDIMVNADYLGEQLLAKRQHFDVENLEDVNTLVGMHVSLQKRIDAAASYAGFEIKKCLGIKNSLDARFGPALAQIVDPLMKRKVDKKSGLEKLKEANFNANRGRIYFTETGGFEIFDKAEFDSWLDTRDEKDCPDLGIEIELSATPTLIELPADLDDDILGAIVGFAIDNCPGANVISSQTTETRSYNSELLTALMTQEKDALKVGGARVNPRNLFGKVKFGEADGTDGARGWSENNIAKKFNEARKGNFKYLGLTDPKLATPYKIEAKKDDKETENE